MKILSLDCTANSASCAICEDKTIIAQSYVNSARKHSETLAPMIEQLFKNASLEISDIDMFTCNVGPGSFTGVRIGAAQIKGFAFGRNKPCVPVSTLKSLAYNLCGFCGIICSVMDARRNQLYCAIFHSDGNKIKRISDDMVISLDELSEKLKGYSEAIYFVGDGYYLAKKIGNANIKDTPEVLINQNAHSTALCALEAYYEMSDDERAKLTDKALAPTYLRLSQAERCRLENTKS